MGNLTWKFTVAPKQDSFSASEPAKVRDLIRMNEEEWNALYEEIKESVEQYLNYLSDLL